MAHQLTSPYDALTLDELRRRKTLKWTYHKDDVIPAWVAEMDYPVAAPIREAVGAAMDSGETGYRSEDDASGLPHACAAWLRRSFGTPVEPAQIRVIADVLRGIELGIQLFSRSESPVVVTTPSYPPFFEVVRAAGREIIQVPMTHDGDLPVFDLDAMESALRGGAGTVILCNPYNPLGRVFTREELLALSEIVEQHRARVVVDEVHAPLIYPGSAHLPYCTVSDAAALHSVTLMSASKGWNIPGLKCAQMVLTNPVDLQIWNRLPFVRRQGASILGMVANTAAYEKGGPWLEQTVAYLDDNRMLLAELLSRHLPEVSYVPPQATYLAWLDCRALHLPDPAHFFLEHARVGLQIGATFGSPGIGHVRLNFATSRAILTEIVERMARAVHRRAE